MILNLDDGQVFVAVHHENVVNLYLSDVTGQYYVLSLAGVFHDEKFDWFSVDMVEVCRGKKTVIFFLSIWKKNLVCLFV